MLTALHSLAADFAREQRAKPVPLQPHSLMAYVDAAPEQQAFDVAQ
ncbi:hypothetical protein [Sphingomonas aerophila]|uniref:Uncharacterized protein n=1 Tax=Sphingomonas aerophila TaxID=1344948 RepID=A0A7W9BGZ8_9SPHN|nr:hypothetical protein [Sphingomonas aerophila]MBB5716958.1 hypothetical protein [Sphingomonas aerophila]